MNKHKDLKIIVKKKAQITKMASIASHENEQNSANQEVSCVEVDKVDTRGITFGKAKKVGKSTTEYEVSFDDDNAKKTTGGSKKCPYKKGLRQ